jgi:putative Holliday junction resolvase
MARVLGVDLGARRIGLARSDETGTLASPLRVLRRTADRELDHRAIVDAAHEEDAARIVVGLPISLNGSEGPAARAVRDEVEQLRIVAGSDLPGVVHDERWTTVTADRGLADAGVRGRARREVVDAAAAAVMLQAWLVGAR